MGKFLPGHPKRPEPIRQNPPEFNGFHYNYARSREVIQAAAFAFVVLAAIFVFVKFGIPRLF